MALYNSTKYDSNIIAAFEVVADELNVYGTHENTITQLQQCQNCRRQNNVDFECAVHLTEKVREVANASN